MADEQVVDWDAEAGDGRRFVRNEGRWGVAVVALAACPHGRNRRNNRDGRDGRVQRHGLSSGGRRRARAR